jgi:hypothetical protein
MKRVTKIETRDGSLHDSTRDAKRHADKAYGDALLRIGRALAQQKYTFVTDYIDRNLDAFAELKALKEDAQLADDNNEEESHP